MVAGLVAFGLAALFLGATLYVSLVEQQARLALDDNSLLKEWKPSDRRGFALLATLALISALFGLGAFYETGDFRFIFGAIVILASWAYVYLVLVPMNNELLAVPDGTAGPQVRARVRRWSFFEQGLAVFGLVSALLYFWALI